jgi:hypothetical protein
MKDGSGWMRMGSGERPHLAGGARIWKKSEKVFGMGHPLSDLIKYPNNREVSDKMDLANPLPPNPPTPRNEHCLLAKLACLLVYVNIHERTS